MSDNYAQMSYNTSTSNSDAAGVRSTERRLTSHTKGTRDMATSDSTTFKQCKKCGIEKPVREFHKHKREPDGYRTICKLCRSQEEGFRYKPTPRAGYHYCTICKHEFPATSEFFSEYKGAYSGLRSWCKNCHRQYSREWEKANPEKANAKSRLYRRVNAERINAVARQRARETRLKDPEKRRSNIRNYRARKRAAGGMHTAADIQAQYERQKGKCYWCGIKVGKKYHVDHVIPLSRGGSNDPSNLVIACQHCNDSKGAKLPHEWEGGNGRLL